MAYTLVIIHLESLLMRFERFTKVRLDHIPEITNLVSPGQAGGLPFLIIEKEDLLKTDIRSWSIWIVIAVSILAAGGSTTSQAVSAPIEPSTTHKMEMAFDHVGTEPAFTTNEWQSAPAIQVTQTLTYTTYLPIVTRGHFIAYTYQDDFEDWESGWSWGTSPFDYGYKQDGDGSRVYQINVQDEYELAFVTGPQDRAIALGNFQYEAWMRIGSDQVPMYWYDEYGILLSPKPIDPAALQGANAYTFHIRLRIADDRDSSYSVAKWSTLDRNNRSVLVEVEESDYITDVARVWNRFRITRHGDTLDFYLTHEGKGDWKHVYSITDGALPDQFHIGFYAMHSKDDFGDYEIEFQFDNLWLSAYP
jgi:hypothetical protein